MFFLELAGEQVMKVLFCSFMLVSVMAIQGIAFQSASRVAAKKSVPAAELKGRWRVKFFMTGLEKNLILVSRARGVASFVLLDTGPDNKPVADAAPATWSQLTNDRVSFSGEVELPIGTCCREIGSLIFKGRFTSSNSISGKLVFVTSVDEEESPYKLKSGVGTFTATRMPANP